MNVAFPRLCSSEEVAEGLSESVEEEPMVKAEEVIKAEAAEAVVEAAIYQTAAAAEEEMTEAVVN